MFPIHIDMYQSTMDIEIIQVITAIAFFLVETSPSCFSLKRFSRNFEKKLSIGVAGVLILLVDDLIFFPINLENISSIFFICCSKGSFSISGKSEC